MSFRNSATQNMSRPLQTLSPLAVDSAGSFAFKQTNGVGVPRLPAPGSPGGPASPCGPGSPGDPGSPGGPGSPGSPGGPCNPRSMGSTCISWLEHVSRIRSVPVPRFPVQSIIPLACEAKPNRRVAASSRRVMPILGSVDEEGTAVRPEALGGGVRVRRPGLGRDESSVDVLGIAGVLDEVDPHGGEADDRALCDAGVEDTDGKEDVGARWIVGLHAMVVD